MWSALCRRSVMCGLHYGVGLEELQMFQTHESFSRCNKVGLVKTILRSHSHKSRVSAVVV